MRSNTSTLFCAGLTSSGVLCPVLTPAFEEGYRQIGMGSDEGSEDAQVFGKLHCYKSVPGFKQHRTSNQTWETPMLTIVDSLKYIILVYFQFFSSFANIGCYPVLGGWRIKETFVVGLCILKCPDQLCFTSTVLILFHPV